MDYRFIISIFTCVTLSNVISVDVYSSPELITVKKGDPYELSCYAPNVEIKGCLITDPSGKSFILWAGATYEGGRVKEKGDGQFTCAVAISKAEDKDNGKWQCQISTMDANNNAVASTADVDVLVHTGSIPGQATKSNSLYISITITIGAIVAVLVIVIVFRVKRMLCFASS